MRIQESQITRSERCRNLKTQTGWRSAACGARRIADNAMGPGVASNATPQLSRGHLAKQGKSRRPPNTHVHQLAYMSISTLKHDNLVTSRPSHQPRSVGFTRTFAKDFNFTSDKCATPAFRPLIHNLHQVGVARFLDVFGDLIVHFRGRRIAPFGVFEHESIIEPNSIHEGTRLDI